MTPPKRFESKISSLEDSKDLSTISLSELLNAFQAQEQRRAIRQEGPIEKAFQIQKENTTLKNEKEKGSQSQVNANQKSYPPCKYCKKSTHLEKYCWWRPDAICGSCKQTGHVTKVCKFIEKSPQQAQAVDVEVEEEHLFTVSCFHNQETSNSWLIDSGCTHHMSFNATLFKELDESYSSKVKVGNGNIMEVKGRGTIAIPTRSGIKLIQNVLYVPDLSQNLLSVGQMLEKGYSLQFKNNICTIYNGQEAEVLSIKMKKKIFAMNWNEAEPHVSDATEVLEKFSMEDCKPVSTLTPTNEQLSKNEDDQNDEHKSATNILRDNISTISSVKKHIFCGKPKHMKIKKHFVKEAQQSNEVNLVHCSSEDQLADLFTKALPKEKSEELKKKIGILHKNAKEEY